MFANVANMKNLFFENPNDEDIKEIGDILYLRDAIIPIDTSDKITELHNKNKDMPFYFIGYIYLCKR